MSPAEIPKRGSHFDLAIAVGILSASGQIFDEDVEQYCFLGELSLDGGVNGVRGVLPMVLAMEKAGVKKIVLPQANAREASLVSGVELYSIRHLDQLVDHFNLKTSLEPWKKSEEDEIEVLCGDKDFSDVRGQELVKRAISIAVAGGHGLFMTGSPSTGKTMLAERIPSVMPKMSKGEMLEVTAIYSVAGQLSEKMPYITARPFRQPHQKLTVAGLLGGGSVPKPGEITLANKGVLFLDEVGEFDYRIMDALRVPLEKKEVNLTRRGVQYTYPADFLLIAASNPCPCGYLGDPVHPCKCSAAEIQRYQKCFSGPMMDRIDLHIYLQPVGYKDLTGKETLSSAEMREAIAKAREQQRRRYRELPISLNHQLSEGNIDVFAPLDEASRQLMALAYDRMKLNPRTLLKVRKMARTIADLDGAENINVSHLQEALQYRERRDER